MIFIPLEISAFPSYKYFAFPSFNISHFNPINISPFQSYEIFRHLHPLIFPHLHPMKYFEVLNLDKSVIKILKEIGLAMTPVLRSWLFCFRQALRIFGRIIGNSSRCWGDWLQHKWSRMYLRAGCSFCTIWLWLWYSLWLAKLGDPWSSCLDPSRIYSNTSGCFGGSELLIFFTLQS